MIKKTKVEPKKERHVLAGFRIANFIIENEYDERKYTYRKSVEDWRTGFLLGKDLKPTRELSEALILELEVPIDGNGYDNQASVCLGGMRLALYKEENAEKFLLNHPLPRKRPKTSERKEVYEMFGGRCAYCGRQISIEDMQVDHRVPHTGAGGEDCIDNYVPACEVCNRVKSNHEVDEFKVVIRNCARIHHGRKESERHIYADSDKIAEYYGLLGDDWKEKTITFYFEKEKNNEQGNR